MLRFPERDPYLWFDWDPKKAESQKQKRRNLPFADAALVFFDRNVQFFDDREDRSHAVGTITQGQKRRIIIVAHTVEEHGDYEIVHIITARDAERWEQDRYFSGN